MKINTSSPVYVVIKSKSNLIKINSNDGSLAVFEENKYSDAACKSINRILNDKAESVESVMIRKSKADSINDHIDRLTQENQRLREVLGNLVETSDMNEAQLSQELLEFYQPSSALVNAQQLLTELKGGEDE